MNKLPLSPDDVTEFTCEAASKHRENIDWADFEKEAYRPFVQSLIDASIAAEWSHRIAVETGRIEAEVEKLYWSRELTLAETRVKESALAYVAWLDSLKGGQNA